MVSLSHMPPKKGKTKFDYVHSNLVSSHLLVTLKFFFFTVYQRMMVSAYIYIYIDAYIYTYIYFFLLQRYHILIKKRKHLFFHKRKERDHLEKFLSRIVVCIG